jgi:hypothetical protein
MLGSNFIEACFKRMDAQMYNCNLPIRSDKAKKQNGAEHSIEVALGCGTKHNLLRHLDTWHPEVLQLCRSSDTAGKTLVAFMSELMQFNHRVLDYNQRHGIVSAVKKWSTKVFPYLSSGFHK